MVLVLVFSIWGAGSEEGRLEVRGVLSSKACAHVVQRFELGAHAIDFRVDYLIDASAQMHSLRLAVYQMDLASWSRLLESRRTCRSLYEAAVCSATIGPAGLAPPFRSGWNASDVAADGAGGGEAAMGRRLSLTKSQTQAKEKSQMAARERHRTNSILAYMAQRNGDDDLTA